MLPPLSLEQTITCLLREEWGRMLASLTASFGDLQLAEDVLQEAAERACSHWEEQGLPSSPVGWMMTTARRLAIDQLRRGKRFREILPQLQYECLLDEAEASPHGTSMLEQAIPDKRLELIFTCCHPALDAKTRVALTLRTLGGLETTEIAKAFMVSKTAMAQRLVRARHKIRVAGIAWEIPTGDNLETRLDGVLAVVYFIFNEGYAASSGPSLLRKSLIDEAIRLGRILHGLLPSSTEVMGLLSLMLLHDSRCEARQDRQRRLIALQDQNRRRWDVRRIAEGIALLEEALSLRRPGPYQIQAAISAVHAESPDWSSTDWPQIVALYDVLHHLQPSPVVRLNQAVALSYADSAEAGLKRLEPLAKDKRMQEYQPYRVALSDLQYRTGHIEPAIDNLKHALSLTDSEQERCFLQTRLQTLMQLA